VRNAFLQGQPGLIFRACWQSWYRWTTLAMLAAAFLTITAAAERAGSAGPPGDGATSTAPGKATTSGKPASSEDHDLRLEY
jgi:hypothetical protein